MSNSLTILRAVVTAVDDSAGLQAVSVRTKNGKDLDNVEVFRAYGITSTPLPGAEGILLRVGGDRSHPLFICVDDRRHRIRDSVEGEVVIYTDEGDSISMKRGNLLDVVCGTKITVTCPDVEVQSSSKITLDAPIVDIPNGDLTVQGISFLDHVHPENDNGGPTGVPQ